VMKCFTNAKERDFDEWAALFAKADPRFRFLGVRTPLGSKASLIEAEWCTNEEAVVIDGVHVDGAEIGVVKTASVEEIQLDDIKLDVLKGEVVA
jgi:hypothetical protein